MRTALVTGVSRREGIGFAIAAQLLDDGLRVVVHHHAPHDHAQAWGGDDLAVLLAELRAHGDLGDARRALGRRCPGAAD